ncbi:MAG: helix-turn-helix domain-containing protein, partial [Thermoplasmata archaeon]|nr:helix-turn-helix domain-containing protein [Thermoplasmata archaeon]
MRLLLVEEVLDPDREDDVPLSQADRKALLERIRRGDKAIEEARELKAKLRRAMVILSSAQGFAPSYIARLVGYSPDWVRTLIREFDLHGFKMLKPNWKAGGNWKFTQEQKD